MNKHLGDRPEDSTIWVEFTTHDKDDSSPLAPSTAFEAADIVILKKTGTGTYTAKSTTNGITMTSPINSIVGLHGINIDTSNDTGDAGFWATNSHYTIVLDPDETVDAIDPMTVLGDFTIELSGGILALVKARLVGTIASGTHNPQTGDAYAIVNHGTYGNAALNTDIDAILADTGTDGVVVAAGSKTGYSISGTKTTLDALNDISAAQVNAEVDSALDTAIPGSPTANSINERVKAIDDKLPTGNIADASVCTETRLSELDAANLPTDVASVKTDTTAILVDTGTDGVVVAAGSKTGYSISGTKTTLDALNDITTAQVNAEVDTALADYDAPTRAELTSDKNEIITEVNANETKIDTIDGIADKLDSAMEIDGVVYRFTTNALEQAPGGSGGVDVTSINGDATAAANLQDLCVNSYDTVASRVRAVVRRWF